MDMFELSAAQLHRREEWLRRSTGGEYFTLVHSFWFHVTEDLTLRDALSNLSMRYSRLRGDVRAMVEGETGLVGRTVEEQAAVAYFVFEAAMDLSTKDMERQSESNPDAKTVPSRYLKKVAEQFTRLRVDELARRPAALAQAFHNSHVVPLVQYLEDVLASRDITR